MQCTYRCRELCRTKLVEISALFSDNSARLSEYLGNKTCSMALKVVQRYLHLLTFSADQLCDVHSAYCACIGQVHNVATGTSETHLEQSKAAVWSKLCMSGANFVCPATSENFFPFKHKHFFHSFWQTYSMDEQHSMLQID